MFWNHLPPTVVRLSHGLGVHMASLSVDIGELDNRISIYICKRFWFRADGETMSLTFSECLSTNVSEEES